MVTLGSYVNLPSPGSKQAPKSFKGNHREVERFIAHFEYLCSQKSITDPKEKCLGLVQYCSYDVADLIEGLEEYTTNNYDDLIKKFQHLYDSNRRKGEYHIGHIDDFARAWRKEEIRTLEMFLQYHREYIQVAGVLRTTQRIDAKEFNRGFWEGLHRDTRDRIERRMMDDEPALDLSVPFETNKVIKAAEHIFNRNRFDKHIREGRSVGYEGEKNRGKKKQNYRDKAEENSDQESEDEEVLPFWKKSQTSDRAERGKSLASPSDKPAVKKREEKDEINDLVSKLDGLTIDQPLYRSTYVQLCLRAPKISDLYPRPSMPNIRSYAAVETREPPDERRRDLPPHQQAPLPDRRFPDRRFEERRFEDRRDVTCFGCGNHGHTMNQCAKLEALIDQGHIRRVIGKLRWADGSNIIKEPEESWASAVVRRLQQRDKVSGTMEEKEQHKGVYLIEVVRNESDAESDEQEELGWRSGTTTEGYLQAYGAERTTRISKEAKAKAQLPYSPPKTHRVKEFPSRRHLDKPGRKDLGVVPKNADFNRGQNRFEDIPVPVPIDISPAKFEGELDSQLVPMEVEEVVVGERVDHRRKVPLRDAERTIGNIGQTRPKRKKAQSEVVNGILSLPLTLSLQEIASISPSVRRDLATTLKAIRDDQPGDVEIEPSGSKEAKASEDPKGVFLGNLERVDGREARGDLLRIQITIGNATMIGVVDSGSMINMISAKKLEESGLPSVALKGKSFKITGVNGGTSVCKSWVPGATILVSADKKATYGDVYVLEDADFEFIAGRPWSTLNGGKIEERTRGTYVSWITDDLRYEINASKTSDLAVNLVEAQVDSSRTEVKDSDEEEKPIAALVVRVNKGTEWDLSDVPDSQESGDELDYGEFEGPKGGKEVEGKEQWTEEEGVLEEGKEEEEENRGLTPTPSEKGKGRQREESVEDLPDQPSKKSRGNQRHQKIIIDQDLEEGFSRMIQTGANDEEWEKFCGEEKRRLAQGKQQWFDWMDSDDEGEQPQDTAGPSHEHNHESSDPEGRSMVPRDLPREVSQTLGTPPPSVTERVKLRPRKGERSVSTKVVARRTKRVSKETTCSMCGGAPMNQSKKYRRKGRAVRTVHRRVTALPDPSWPKEEEGLDMRSYGVWIVPRLEDGNKGSGPKESVDDKKPGEKTLAKKTREDSHDTKHEQGPTRKGSAKLSPQKDRTQTRVVDRPFLRKARQETGEEPQAPVQQLTSSQVIEAWRDLTPVRIQAPGDVDKLERSEESPIMTPGRDNSEVSQASLDTSAKPHHEIRQVPVQGRDKDRARFRRREPYLTWDGENCTLHVPEERAAQEKSRDRITIQVPPDYLPRGRLVPELRQNTKANPAVTQTRAPRQAIYDEPVRRVRDMRQELGKIAPYQNIRDDREAEPVIDEGGEKTKEEKEIGEAGEHSPSQLFEGSSQRCGRAKMESEKEKKGQDIFLEIRQHTNKQTPSRSRLPLKTEGRRSECPTSQNWRQKPPHPSKSNRLTSKNRFLLLLLLSLLLIPPLLVHLSPTTTMTNLTGANKRSKGPTQVFSIGSDRPEHPGHPEHPSTSSGDRSVPATRPDEWNPSLDRLSEEESPKEDLGTIGERLVGKKNLGILLRDGQTVVPLSLTSSRTTLEKLDRATSERIPRTEMLLGDLGVPYYKMREDEEDLDQKEVSVIPRPDFEKYRRIVPRDLGHHGIKLEVTKREFSGGAQPFLSGPKDVVMSERETEGREPPPNSPMPRYKIGPPKSKKPGKTRTFDDMTTIESKARARDVSRGGSEIRIIYQERNDSPLPLEFWQGLPSLSSPTSSSSSGISTTPPSSGMSVDQEVTQPGVAIRPV